MKSILSFSLSILLLSACAKTSKQPVVAPKVISKEQKLIKFEEGNKQMDTNQFRQAIETFESAHINYPATTLDSLLLFNLGLSYQQIDECQKAYDTFRKVIAYSNEKSPKLAARAKLKLAQNLACLGQGEKALLVLVELYNKRKHLPPAVGEAEVPAQIAVLYARNDQKDMAQKYLSIAEKGLLRLSGNRELMAETLYLMGDFSKMISKKVAWPKYISTYSLSKKYLVRAILLGENNWSPKALQTLTTGFGRMWSFESSIQVNEDGQSSAETKRNAKIEKHKLLKAMLTQVVRTKLLITPTKKPKPLQKELSNFLDKEELKVRNALASLSVAPETTKESDRLNQLKREGRIKQ